MQSRPHDFLVATAICFLVNLFCYLAIKYVSATSFKVAGEPAWRAAGCSRDAVRRTRWWWVDGRVGWVEEGAAVQAWLLAMLRMHCCHRICMCLQSSPLPAPSCLATSRCAPCRLPQECDGGVGRHPAGGCGHAARAAGKPCAARLLSQPPRTFPACCLPCLDRRQQACIVLQCGAFLHEIATLLTICCTTAFATHLPVRRATPSP